MPDAIFADPRLAEVYDVVDADRSDLDVYAALVEELGASRVLDVGCGTGTFACMLAGRGVDVVGADPAVASLDLARPKSNADRVRWVGADAAGVPPVAADLATMTGNVAQVFLTDADWVTALRSVRRALRPGGWFVFEVRDPERRAWEQWTRDATDRSVEHPVRGVVRTWTELTDVRLPFVSFRQVYEFASDGAALTSSSMLRFRDRREILESLGDVGFSLDQVRDAPDRPGRELVFLARRADP